MQSLANRLCTGYWSQITDHFLLTSRLPGFLGSFDLSDCVSLFMCSCKIHCTLYHNVSPDANQCTDIKVCECLMDSFQGIMIMNSVTGTGGYRCRRAIKLVTHNFPHVLRLSFLHPLFRLHCWPKFLLNGNHFRTLFVRS